MELHQINTKLPFVCFGESRVGGRSDNQDTFGYDDTPFGLLVTVCDGMGGGPGGKTASSIAVKEIVEGVSNASSDETPTNALLKAIHKANLAILDAVEENSKLKGMGTTCTALLINKESAIVAHVGDSRVYQLRCHRKVFRTFDHSMVFGLVKEKVIRSHHQKQFRYHRTTQVNITKHRQCEIRRFFPVEIAVRQTGRSGSGPGCPEQACKRWKSYLNGKLPKKSDFPVFLERLYIAEEYGNL